jgi:hypothetical protein
VGLSYSSLGQSTIGNVVNMWDAITYVTTGITLIAFLAAIAAWIYKSKLDERERLIQTAPESDRGPLVRNALEFFNVETAGLNKEQQYKIALEQIRWRGQRFKVSAAVICLLAIVTACVTAYAIARQGHDTYGSSAVEVKSVDPDLVGSWQSSASFNGGEFQLLFQFGQNGQFSRQYFADDAGIVDARGGVLISNRPPEKWRFMIKDANSLVLSRADETSGSIKQFIEQHGNSFDLKRVGPIEDQDNLLVGKWNGSVFFDGALWESRIEVGRDAKYRSHTEARDEGRIEAASNKYKLFSTWDIRPLEGTYSVLSPTSLRLNLYPFGPVTLQKYRQ